MDIILLHGYGFDNRIWDDLKLDPIHKIWSPNLPGFGDHLYENFDYGMEMTAGWLNDYINKHVENNFLLIGHSMGGYIALEYLANYNHNCIGLGLVHSHCFTDSDQKMMDRVKKAQFIERNGTGLFLDPFYKSVFHQIDQSDYFKSTIDLYVENFSIKTLSGYMVGMSKRKDHQSTLMSINFPVLIFHGLHDTLIDEKLIYEMASYLESGIVKIDQKSAHMSMLENSDYLKDAINSLIDRSLALLS
jgi:pimeloyl-ACP methyl ester carboxylesterase